MLDLKNIIQALLLSNNNKMLSLKDIKALLHEFTESQILAAIDDLNEDQNQVCSVVNVAGMYYLKVKSAFNGYLARLHHQEQMSNLSKMLIESIAAIAMHQPITRDQLEDKIGKKISDEIFFQLQDLQWIRLHTTKSGLQEYLSTTKQFLQYFNISSVIELESRLNKVLLDSSVEVVW